MVCLGFEPGTEGVDKSTELRRPHISNYFISDTTPLSPSDYGSYVSASRYFSGRETFSVVTFSKF